MTALRVKKMSQLEVRPDYLTYATWTPAEAAHRVGYQIQTIRLWLRQKRFARGDAVGPYCVDRDSFLEYVKTGVAQC